MKEMPAICYHAVSGLEVDVSAAADAVRHNPALQCAAVTRLSRGLPQISECEAVHGEERCSIASNDVLLSFSPGGAFSLSRPSWVAIQPQRCLAAGRVSLSAISLFEFTTLRLSISYRTRNPISCSISEDTGERYILRTILLPPVPSQVCSPPPPSPQRETSRRRTIALPRPHRTLPPRKQHRQ